MKKVIAVVIVLSLMVSLVVFGSGFAADNIVKPPEGITFRDTEWGLSKNEVIEIEGREPDVIATGGEADGLSRSEMSGGDFVYYDTILGLSCEIFYCFEGDKLTRGQYNFSPEYYDSVNLQKYFDNYEIIDTALKELYGGPTSEEHTESSEFRIAETATWEFEDGSVIKHNAVGLFSTN